MKRHFHLLGLLLVILTIIVAVPTFPVQAQEQVPCPKNYYFQEVTRPGNELGVWAAYQGNSSIAYDVDITIPPGICSPFINGCEGQGCIYHMISRNADRSNSCYTQGSGLYGMYFSPGFVGIATVSVNFYENGILTATRSVAFQAFAGPKLVAEPEVLDVVLPFSSTFESIDWIIRNEGDQATNLEINVTHDLPEGGLVCSSNFIGGTNVGVDITDNLCIDPRKLIPGRIYQVTVLYKDVLYGTSLKLPITIRREDGFKTFLPFIAH